MLASYTGLFSSRFIPALVQSLRTCCLRRPCCFYASELANERHYLFENSFYFPIVLDTHVMSVYNSEKHAEERATPEVVRARDETS